MENQSSAKNDNGEIDDRRRDESDQETAKYVSLQEFSQLLGSRPRKWHHGSRPRRQIHRVPPQLRLRRQQSEQVYDPVMVSLGPYHHGKPELSQAEEFKYICLDWCAQGNEETKVFFYNKILEEIDVIRGCYADVSILEKYNDKALALMMLLDACFIINFMEQCVGIKKKNYLDWLNCLGVAAPFPFTAPDIILLENQIPFQVLKMLISLQYEKQEGEELVHRFLGWMRMERNRVKIPRENEEPPLHILEAFRRVVVEKHNTELDQQKHNQLQFRWPKFLARQKKQNKNVSFTCCSVMDLKAKGIQFRPSSWSFKDIKFKSHAFYGQIHLPIRYFSHSTQVTLSNMIAYEISPSRVTEPVILSYTNFMKSLIESPADVKELQEKGILFNRFANLEQVVRLFKEIDTFGLLEVDVFEDVRQRIAEHCVSRAKTWIADLVHTWFQSPWTVIALFAATFLLCLTFLQTLFTIHPVK